VVAWVVAVVVQVASAVWVLALWVVVQAVLVLWEAQARAQSINLAIWQASLRMLLHRP
jgi:hypothetical protein